MKILLVNPIWSFQNYPPINLTEIASYLIKNNFKYTKILDLNFEIKNKLNIEDIVQYSTKKILSKKPDIVAITCNAIQFPFVCELSKEIKKQRSYLPIIVGGVMASLNPSLTLKQTRADYIIRGEGESTIVELVNAIKNNSNKKNVYGISYIDKHGKIQHNVSRELLDINKLPMPAFNLISKNLNQSKLVWIVASRGCSYKCKFCSGNTLWHYQRRKNVNDVYKQIKILKIKYGITDFIFGDDCLTLNKQWVLQLCNKIKSLEMQWGCLARVDSVDDEILQFLKQSGCHHIYHGIESGNPDVREQLDKQVKCNTNKYILDTIKKEIKLGFQVTCSFMTGVPFETKDNIKDTFLFAKKLQKLGARIQLWILTPYLGLKIVKQYKSQLIKIDKISLELQLDIFDKGQFYLYRNFINKYDKFNPDNYIFLPQNMSLDEFVKCFHKMQKGLGLEQKNIQLTNKEIFILKNT